VKADVLIPWNKNEPEEWKNGNELIVADRGGFIYEPRFGLHESVGELDFSSLYPTIMRNMNLSGETVRCTCCLNSTNRVPELGWNICERWDGIVPRSLDILLRKRLLYKKYKNEASDPPTRLRYDQRQAALKWILVCS
jgi:DNA polymerase elongation subunit (family B)